MTNYYEELKLDKTLSLNELRENLIRLESIWTDRASTRPEKAAEMLVLINQAEGCGNAGADQSGQKGLFHRHVQGCL